MLYFNNKKSNIKKNIPPVSTEIKDDVKRSNMNNINRNTNQSQPNPIIRQPIQFGLRQISTHAMHTLFVPITPVPVPDEAELMFPQIASLPFPPVISAPIQVPSTIPSTHTLFIPPTPVSSSFTPFIVDLKKQQQKRTEINKIISNISSVISSSTDIQQSDIPKDSLPLLIEPDLEPDQTFTSTEHETDADYIAYMDTLRLIYPVDGNHDSVKEINNMTLPFKPIHTTDTEIIIDSEPNSPKVYEYSLSTTDIKEFIHENIDTYIKERNLISKTEMESILVQNSLNERATNENYMENFVNTQIQLIQEEQLIQPVVEKFLTQIIQADSLILLETNADDYEDESAKTKFEEMIEPAVARIVQRIIKYDYAQEKVLFPSETNSINLDINYDEVYDYELQEQGHFEAPQIDIDALPQQQGMFNPMYNNNPPADILNIPTLSFFKEDNKRFYKNELRSDTKFSSKWLRFGSGIETGIVIDMVLDRMNKKIYM